MRIREIEDVDLDAVRELLAEGFPSRSQRYWVQGLASLRARPRVGQLPQYGYVIDADGACQGLMLLISSNDELGHIRSNLSCWYVRDHYRKYATLLYLHALKLKQTTFVNLSPSSHVLPIIETLGFKPYTEGVVLMDLRCTLRRASKGTRIRSFTSASSKLLPDSQAARAERHLSYGCSALVVESESGVELVLYRMRFLKNRFPCAQFLYGCPARIANLATPLLRHLGLRGAPLALIDQAIGDQAPHVGRLYRGQHVRYFRGGEAPAVGDLADTELAILGP